MQRQATPRRRKFTILALVIALHAVMIALLLQQAAKVQPPVPVTAIAMFEIEAKRPAAAAKPPPPSLPAKVADAFVPVTALSIPDDAVSDEPVGAAAACSTVDKVREGLLLDAAAVDATRNAPPETRSIADAVVLWNVGWAPPALTLADPLFVVRTAVERILANLPANCLDEPIAGPRLVPITDASGLRTIFIVFGSGTWTWRALLTPPSVAGTQEALRPPVVALPVDQ